MCIEWCVEFYYMCCVYMHGLIHDVVVAFRFRLTVEWWWKSNYVAYCVYVSFVFRMYVCECDSSYPCGSRLYVRCIDHRRMVGSISFVLIGFVLLISLLVCCIWSVSVVLHCLFILYIVPWFTPISMVYISRATSTSSFNCLDKPPQNKSWYDFFNYYQSINLWGIIRVIRLFTLVNGRATIVLSS